MDTNAMKAMQYDELRTLYKGFLCSLNLSKLTIDTAYSDTFYLWRNGSKEVFWDAVTATDFENVSRNTLLKVLSEKSTGNVDALVSGYLSHLRRFHLFLSSDETVTSVEHQQQITVKSTHGVTGGNRRDSCKSTV
jgi:hypothetical protein